MGNPKFTPNPYRIEGDTASIQLGVRRNATIREAIIDLADLECVLWFGRWLRSGCKHGRAEYVVCQSPQILLHRLLLSPPVGMVVDHINRNSLDCRRANMRLCTQAENMQNRPAQRGSVSGVRNVYWVPEQQVWCVQMKVERRRISLGRFDCLDDAIAMAAEGRRRYMPYAVD